MYIFISIFSLLLIPIIIKIIMKGARLYSKPSREELDEFNRQVEYLKKNEEIKKSYRNYLFFFYFFGMFVFGMGLFLLASKQADIATNTSKEPGLIFIMLVFMSISGFVAGLPVAYAVMFVFNRIFQRNITLKYLDVFSLNINKSFEKIYSDAKMMKTLKSLKFSNFIYFVFTVAYFSILISLLMYNYFWK